MSYNHAQYSRMLEPTLLREPAVAQHSDSVLPAPSCKSHVALLVPSLGYGGVEQVMLRLAAGLHAAGCDVDLVAANGGGEFSARVRDARLVDLRSRRVLTSLPALAMYFRRERPDVAIAAMTHTNVVALLARNLSGCSTRIVATEHAGLSRVAGHSGRARVRAMPILARALYPSADAIVAVSHGVADDTAHVAGVPRKRIRVIYNPVITDELFAKSREPASHPWIHGSERKLILAVGRLEPEKDFATLIRAFALLRQQRAARLMILGEGSERIRLQGLCRELRVGDDDVALPGFCANPYPYMRQAAVLALSSLWEGLGLVLVEALALGTPVVATDCPSGPREILQDGRLGRLVPVGDPRRLAEALVEALDSPPARPGIQALRAFEFQTAIRAYCELVASLSLRRCQKRKRPRCAAVCE